LSIAFMGAVMYFFIIRPQRNRVRQQQALQSGIEVGDEVMTSSGIFATVVEIDDDNETVVLEIAPGTEVRMLRRAITQRLFEEPDADEDYSDEELDQDEDYSEEESGEEEADNQP
ncbi:MAG: preprotein translocase subunit YajC, partial [Actinomycetota bacterium]